MPVTVSHSLSATTPDDPAYEIQPKHWNSNHLATINAVGSEISGAFGNGGGITFGLSADGKVTAAAPAGVPSPVHVSAGTTEGDLGTIVFGNSNGISFQLSGSTITATVKTNYAGVGETVGTVAGTDIGLTVNTDGVSIAYPKAITTQTVQSQNFIAAVVSGANGDGSYTSGTLSVKAGNNITLSTGANVFSIHGVAAQSVQSQNFIAAIVSGANGDGTYTSGTMSIKAGNNITLSTGANVMSIHGVAAQSTQTQNMVAVVGSGANGNGTFSSGTLSLKAGNNITLSTGANVVSVHGEAAQTVQTQNMVAIVASGANGNGTFSSGSVSLKIGSNLTMSTGANVISFYAADPGAAAEANQHQLLGANTAGNTTASGSTIGLSGLNVTLSGANNSNIVISAPATSSLVGASAISVSTNGSTISVFPTPLSGWDNIAAGEITTLGTAQANSLVSVKPFRLQWPLAASNIRVAASVAVGSAANNSSAYLDVSMSGVIYSRNASTLSSMFSFSNSMTQSFSSNATATVGGAGVVGLTGTFVATTMTPGDYWLALHVSTANSATGGANTTALGNTISMALVEPLNSAPILLRQWGAQSADSQGLASGQGIISTGATRATIAFSDLVQTGSRAQLANLYFGLRNATYQA